MSAHRDEAGFTLIELLIAMILMALIMSVLTTAMIEGFRTTDSTANRLSQSSQWRYSVPSSCRGEFP